MWREASTHKSHHGECANKHYFLSKKKLLKGSHFFSDEDLTSKQQEVRREEVEKIRATRNEGKRAWLYNGKAVIAIFAPHGKAGQQFGSKEKPVNSIIRRKQRDQHGWKGVKTQIWVLYAKLRSNQILPRST